MTSILGISAFYHDSAAALVQDGRIVAAAQEERFSRIRHDHAFPKLALASCLEQAGLDVASLDHVAFYDKPLLKFERLLETYLAVAPLGFNSFRKAVPIWMKQKLHLPRLINEGLGGKWKGRIVFPSHHESHAASAFFPSPHERAAVITCDGVGEWDTTTWGIGEGNRISLKQAIHFPHSLGLLYSAFTYFCGFKVNSGEYKLMGLAPYGEPRFKDVILKELLDLRPDGSFRLNLRYFTYPHGLRMTGAPFARLFGGAARDPETEITQREMDLAASVQAVTEEVVLTLARHAHSSSKAKYLCLAGGVALNCVANGRLLRESPFESIWVQPAAGDAGGALGAALLTWHQLLDKPRTPDPGDSQQGSWLGPSWTGASIEAAVGAAGAKATRIDDETALLSRVAQLLDAGKVVGWFHGRMEFGPRALGARSILGDARKADMQAVMNLKIKFRESFRPFAPVVLAHRAHEWFGIDPRHESPYMLMVAPVLLKWRRALSDADVAAMKDPDLRKRVNVRRSEVPAVTHVDGSARLQTVDERRHGRFFRLLLRFEQLTGCPILVNTSFNVRGEPIVNRPEEALNCFLRTAMDVLVLEDYLLIKDEQPEALKAMSAEGYLSRFDLD